MPHIQDHTKNKCFEKPNGAASGPIEDTNINKMTMISLHVSYGGGCKLPAGFADSSCLVLQGRWDLRSSPKMTEGDKNMVAPLTQELLNSNTSSSSKLRRLWIYTKQNICQRGDLYRGTDTTCVVHVHNFCYSFCICAFGF